MSAERLGVPARLVAVLILGAVLNPLNSTMIAIALVSLQHAFEVGVATSSWLVSSFYLAASIGQPLMGRFVDLFGARRLFVGGLLVQFVAFGLAAVAPGFWWLVALRVLQGIGSSTAYPAALVLIRAAATRHGDSSGKPPTGALAALTMSASTTAMLGPALGGMLVMLAGWRAIFLVNLPIILVGVVLALRILPANHTERSSRTSWRGVLRAVDVPGVVLFGTTVALLLVFLLSVADRPYWWLLPVCVALAGALIWWEWRTPEPFIDVRGLVASPALASVLAGQGGVQLVFYCMAFGLPIWLQSVRGYDPGTTGLLVLPLTLTGVLVTPLAARFIRRYGSRRALLVAAVVLAVATLQVQFFSVGTAIWLLVLAIVVLGVPNGFNNISLQTALYDASPPERAGSVGGLFQLFRYLGAMGAMSVLGLLFERDLTDAGLHRVGVVMTVVAVAVLGLAIAARGLRARS